MLTLAAAAVLPITVVHQVQQPLARARVQEQPQAQTVQQIKAVAVVLQATLLALAQAAVQALSSLATLAHSAALVEQLHLQAVIQFTPLHLQERTRRKEHDEPLCTN